METLESIESEERGGRAAARRKSHRRTRLGSGDDPSRESTAGAVMLYRQQRHDPHHYQHRKKNSCPRDEQQLGSGASDVYKASSHLKKGPLPSPAVLLSSAAKEPESKKLSLKVDECSRTSDVQNIASHFSIFSLLPNPIVNRIKRDSTLKREQRFNDQLGKMESLGPPILKGRRHRSASTSKVLEDESGRTHRRHNSHSHTRWVDKERGKEKEKDRDRDRDREREREKEKLRLKTKEDRDVRERSFSEVGNDIGVDAVLRQSKKDKVKHNGESEKISEKYEQEKAEKKARKKARSLDGEDDRETPRSGSLSFTEHPLVRYEEKKRRSSKSKELGETPRIKSTNSTSTEEYLARRSKPTRQELPRSPRMERRVLAHESTLMGHQDSASVAEVHGAHSPTSARPLDCRECERERQEQLRAMALKKEKAHKESLTRTKLPVKEKGKERVVLGFHLDKKENMIQCVSCLSDDILEYDAALLGCGHYFCNDCLKDLFHLSLRDPAHMPPRCCTNEHIPLKHLENLLSYREKKEWNSKYQEYTTANRIYCPTVDCGAWIREKDINKLAKCPKCSTEVCTLCNGKAHGKDECPNDEELKAFVETARANGYQRCFNCRAVVELEKGCNHITCRCTAEFCYLCGDKWKTCECPWFNYEPESDDEEPHRRYPLYGRNRDRRLRGRERQIAEDEALARQVAAEELRENSRGIREIRVHPMTALGAIGHGIKCGMKKSTADHGENGRHHDDARKEKVRNRGQRDRERDCSSKHDHPRDEAKFQRESDAQPTHRRESAPKEERRPKPSQEPVSRPSLTEAAPRRLSANEQRAAFIRRYILGENFGPEEQSNSPIRRPHTSYSSPTPAISPESSSCRRESVNSRRTSDAATTRHDTKHTTPESRHNGHGTSMSGLFRYQARLDSHYRSGSPESLSSPPCSRTSTTDTNGNDTNIKNRTASAAFAASVDANVNTHARTNTNTPKIVPATNSSSYTAYQKTDVSPGTTQHSQEKVTEREPQSPKRQQHQRPHLDIPRMPPRTPATRSTTYPLPLQTPYSYRVDFGSGPMTTEEYARPYTSHGWEGTSFQARRPSWSPLPESFANRVQVTAGGAVLLPRKY